MRAARTRSVQIRMRLNLDGCGKQLVRHQPVAAFRPGDELDRHARRDQTPRCRGSAWVASLSVTPTLRTARLLLDPYVPEDEESFIALFQDTRVSRWMGNGPASAADDRALFRRIFTKVYAQDLFAVWAVRQDRLLVGHAEIKPTDVVGGGHEIIYALAPAVWGSGLGTELAEAIVAYGFDTLGLAEVHATVAAQNKASLALLDRIGFEHIRDITEDDGSTTRVLTRRLPDSAVISRCATLDTP